MGDVLAAAQRAAARIREVGSAEALMREVGIDPEQAAAVWEGLPPMDAYNAFGVALIIGAMVDP